MVDETMRKVYNRCEGIHNTNTPSRNDARLQLNEIIIAFENLILNTNKIITASMRKIAISPTE